MVSGGCTPYSSIYGSCQECELVIYILSIRKKGRLPGLRKFARAGRAVVETGPAPAMNGANSPRAASLSLCALFELDFPHSTP